MASTMNVTIVSGGLGGLGCAIACKKQGMNVTVFEKVKEFLKLGDSIGLNSNSARLLYRWHVGEDLAKIASQAQELLYHNFDSFDIIGRDGTLGNSEERFGCRSLIGHRGDFHLILLEVDMRMGTAVESYNDLKPSIILVRLNMAPLWDHIKL